MNKLEIKREVGAGTVGFFTVAYIIAVNSLILSESGMPYDFAVMATILSSAAGCLLMGFYAKSPIIIIPGMGINALFSYSFVDQMGMTWQTALMTVAISGLIVLIISLTPLSAILLKSIPSSLKNGLTVGLGLFLIFIGLEKGGIIERGAHTLITLGNLADVKVIATLVSIFITMVLFIRGVKGSLLISLMIGSVIALLLGMRPNDLNHATKSSFETLFSISHLSFAGIGESIFWVGVLSLTLVMLFENIGLVYSHLSKVNETEKFTKSFRVVGISALLSGLVGTSPTVAAAETQAALAAGGRTGLTSITTGVWFLISIVAIPLLKWIPDSAVAAIFVLIGGLMLEQIKEIKLNDLSESFPAFLIIAFIPFTNSIVDGMAVGFILYPLLKLATGRVKEVSVTLFIVASLFIFNYVLQLQII